MLGKIYILDEYVYSSDEYIYSFFLNKYIYIRQTNTYICFQKANMCTSPIVNLDESKSTIADISKSLPPLPRVTGEDSISESVRTSRLGSLVRVLL